MEKVDKKNHPRKGETILLCPHVGDETRMFTFLRLGGTPGVFACSECQSKSPTLEGIVKTTVLWSSCEEITGALIQ